MPKLERLDWVAPLSEDRGVTLTDIPEADLFLAQDAGALLIGVMCDSQFQTRRAFAIPYLLRARLGHFDINRIALEESEVQQALTSKPALHRFPNRCAGLTCRLAQVIVSEYDGNAERIWVEAGSVTELSRRLMALPAFGEAKTNWTVGMLGRMEVLPYDGWDGYRVPGKSS